MEGMMASTKLLEIVLAEDDPDDQLLIQDAVDVSGINSNIDIVGNGRVLMNRLLRTDLVRPDLVLLDLNMPEMDGWEVLRSMRMNALTRDIPVVVLTTSTDQRDINLCYEMGANSYISKPNSFDELVRSLEALSLYWSKIVRLPTKSN
jgi:CheY-like chemotaxis protein